jgi:hypothetical protein
MIAALVLCASPACAGSFVSTWNCSRSWYYGYTSCMSTWTRVEPAVRDPARQRLDAIAFQKEDAKWEEFCKPTFKADKYGVRRASYAKKGCDFGRSE